MLIHVFTALDGMGYSTGIFACHGQSGMAHNNGMLLFLNG